MYYADIIHIREAEGGGDCSHTGLSGKAGPARKIHPKLCKNSCFMVMMCSTELPHLTRTITTFPWMKADVNIYNLMADSRARLKRAAVAGDTP